jgi:hypothetical protein
MDGQWLTRSFTMLGPANTLWARFLDLAANGPDLLCVVCQHMSSVERQALHSVNRAMRVAMNATVTSIRCSERTLPTHQQLHEVFPNLSSVDLCIDGRNWQLHLRRLMNSCELLLNKLRHLSLTTTHTARITAVADIQVILKLLTR